MGDERISTEQLSMTNADDETRFYFPNERGVFLGEGGFKSLDELSDQECADSDGFPIRTLGETYEMGSRAVEILRTELPKFRQRQSDEARAIVDKLNDALPEWRREQLERASRAVEIARKAQKNRDSR